MAASRSPASARAPACESRAMTAAPGSSAAARVPKASARSEASGMSAASISRAPAARAEASSCWSSQVATPAPATASTTTPTTQGPQRRQAVSIRSRRSSCETSSMKESLSATYRIPCRFARPRGAVPHPEGRSRPRSPEGIVSSPLRARRFAPAARRGGLRRCVSPLRASCRVAGAAPRGGFSAFPRSVERGFAYRCRSDAAQGCAKFTCAPSRPTDRVACGVRGGASTALC